MESRKEIGIRILYLRIIFPAARILFMLYWECKRRLALLRHLRVQMFDYFANIQYANWMAAGAPPTMNNKAQQARFQINSIMDDVLLSFDLLDLTHSITYRPPPMFGGYIQNIDLIGNLFSLWQFEISPQFAFDCTDRAIGAYERECRRLFRKSFNPLYWLGIFIVWVLRLPFKLLGAAGFDATKVEESFFGKLLKLIWGLALGLATLIPAILETADHWDKIQPLLHKWLASPHR